MDWPLFFESSLGGLATGALYALVALGFVIVYKATRVINFAIGEIMMISAYFFLTFAGILGWNPWLSLVLAVLCGGALGGLVERSIIRPMLGESPIAVVMVTIGLSNMLIGSAQIFWGGEPQVLPGFLPRAPIFLGELYVSGKIASSAGIALVMLILYLAYFRFSRGGVALRATASDQAAAFSMGIGVPRVFNYAWVFGSMAAALAGVLVAASGGLSPNSGGMALAILVVVIFGGLDSILGALLGGLIVGWLETVAGALWGGEYKMLAIFTLLTFALILRPYGLFGTKEIERL
ncbi:MAG: branched-chain amino acid ABC transporter permease [Deferrisomatales bacterium]|nr:branched-chain amino acid ABC transporter permease [Deferrisomatales bacterium]